MHLFELEFSSFLVWVHALLCLTLCNLRTVAHQAPLSMGFSRQEYRSVLPCPSPGVLLEPEVKTKSPVTPVFAGEFFHHWTT